MKCQAVMTINFNKNSIKNLIKNLIIEIKF